MIDFAKLAERRQKYNEFTQTPIGQAFVQFESASISYWQQDGNDRCSPQKLTKLDDKLRETRREFLKLLGYVDAS